MTSEVEILSLPELYDRKRYLEYYLYKVNHRIHLLTNNKKELKKLYPLKKSYNYCSNSDSETASDTQSDKKVKLIDNSDKDSDINSDINSDKELESIQELRILHLPEKPLETPPETPSEKPIMKKIIRRIKK